MKSKFYTSLMKLINNVISSKEFIDRHKLFKNAFTRNRAFPFKYLLVFLLDFRNSSIQSELDNFFKTIFNSDLPIRKICSSAFIQARDKLSHSAFIELYHLIVNFFYMYAKPKKWHDFFLIAFDGSTLNLPKNNNTIKEFGEYSSENGDVPFVPARVSQAFDLLNDVVLDATLDPYSISELDQAEKLIDSIPENSLLLFDRGFGSYWIFNLILSRNLDFCIRVDIQSWKVVREMIESGEKEKIVWIKPSYKAKERCKNSGLSTEPIKVRLIRIDLDNGDIEILVTSLYDSVKYPYEIFHSLYFMRWGVEESYKKLKRRIEIENFSGKKPEFIKQDFYARIFTMNLTAILAYGIHDKISDRCKDNGFKLTQKINWTQAYSKMKNNVVLLFFRKQYRKIIFALQELFFENRFSVREQRKFPRNFKYPKRYYMAYKPI